MIKLNPDCLTLQCIIQICEKRLTPLQSNKQQTLNSVANFCEKLNVNYICCYQEDDLQI